MPLYQRFSRGIINTAVPRDCHQGLCKQILQAIFISGCWWKSMLTGISTPLHAPLSWSFLRFNAKGNQLKAEIVSYITSNFDQRALDSSIIHVQCLGIMPVLGINSACQKTTLSKHVGPHLSKGISSYVHDSCSRLPFWFITDSSI